MEKENPQKDFQLIPWRIFEFLLIPQEILLQWNTTCDAPHQDGECGGTF